MKTMKYLTIMVLLLGITACADGQFRKTVYGNKNVEKKERTAGSFTGVKVSTGIDVYLTQGEKESIIVEADENLHEFIKTEINNGTLNIYSDANIRSAEMKRVYVTMKEINSVNATSAGDVIGETPVKTENLKLSASSAGDIKLEVYAKNIDGNVSSSGDLKLSGEADMLDIDLSSAGDMNAYNLKVREARVSVSSAGDADIYVTEKLIAHASSAGDINYRGDPKYVDAHSSSAGGVHKKQLPN
jgi:anti-sigma28 factor (negative regulator of flagellin synthesis)